MSLKTAIEQTISDAIDRIASASSPDVDPDIPPAEQLISNKIGAYPLDSDFALGPLVRVVIENHTTRGEEFGTEDERVSQLIFGINVIGITGTYSDPSDAAAAASEVEEVIRLHLQQLAFNIETSYNGGRTSYATILNYLGTQFDNGTISGRQTAPIVEAPVAVAPSSVTLAVNPDQAYSGLADLLYTVEIVTPNDAPGSASGLTLRYREGTGGWSAPLPVGDTYVPLSNNVYVAIRPTGVAAAGDSWTIQARTSQQYSIGMWVQAWSMEAEAIAVYD